MSVNAIIKKNTKFKGCIMLNPAKIAKINLLNSLMTLELVDILIKV